MIILNQKNGIVLSENVKMADNFFKRLNGLMFFSKKRFPDGSCLVINPCNSIHMFFMRFPLDVVFVDKEDTVIHINENIKPWRISKIILKSAYVLELPAGTVKNKKLRVGDTLTFMN